MKKYLLFFCFLFFANLLFADNFIRTTENEAYNVMRGVITEGGAYVDKLWFPGDYQENSSIGQVAKLAPGWYYTVSIVSGTVMTNIYTVYRNGIVFCRNLVL